MIPFDIGDTGKSIDVWVQDSSSTTGAGLAGLAYNSAGLTAYYRKGATGSATAITLATQTVGGAYSSGGFVEIDSTNMKGLYRLDMPNAMLDTEGDVTLILRGATNMAPVAVRLTVRPVKSDVKRFGGAAGTFASGRPEVNTTHLAGTSQTARDIGLNVLLTPGTGTGQIKLDGGYVSPNWGDVKNPSTGVALSGTTVGLIDNAITSSKITDGAFTAAKFAAGAFAAVWDTLSASLTKAGSIGKRIVDYLKGDAFARIGAAGAGLTALGDTRIANLDATVSSRNATTPPTAAVISSQVASDLAAAHGAGSWATATGFSTLDAAGVRSAVGLAMANLDTQLADLPTVAEFEARTLVAASYFDPATDLVTLTAAYDAAKTAATQTSVDALATTIGVAGAGLTDLGGMSTAMKGQVNAEVVDTLQTDTPVFGRSVVASLKRIEVSSGNATLTGAGTGTEVLTSEDSSLTATYTVDGSGNISAIAWA